MITRRRLPLCLPIVITFLLPGAEPLRAQQVTPWRYLGLPTGEYQVGVDNAVVRGGRSSARIDGWVATPMGGAGLIQQVRADNYKGQRVRLSAHIRTRDVQGAGGWIALAVAGGGVPVQSSTQQAALTGTADWKMVSTEVDVPPNAVGLNITVTLNGTGSLWIDDVQLESIGQAAAATPAPAAPVLPAQVAAVNDYFRSLPERPAALDFEGTQITPTKYRSVLQPPRAFTVRGLDNVAAFARLVGVVRHFYPAETVRTTNWDDFTIRGVRAVEGAPSADSLMRTLRALFASVASDIVLHPTGQRPTLAKALLPADRARLAIAHWVNTGVVLAAPDPNRRNIYSSVLTQLAAPAGQVPEGVPHPDSAWSAVLGGGVSAVVPIARWLTPEPGAGALQRLPVQPVVADEAASPNDRATRLAGVITIWNVFQHSYPYFDLVKVDWPAELRSALTAAATDKAPPDYHATLNRLVARAQDGHGNVNPMVAGPRRGFLPFAWDWVEGKLVVTHVATGDAAGVQRGAVIERINGESVEQLIAQRELLISSPTPQWQRYRAVSELLADTAGRTVTLRVRTGSAASRDVRVSYAPTRVTEPRPDKIAEVQPGIFYVDISRITDADFTTALPRLQQARGIVFDLRGYPNMVSTPAILARLSSDSLRSAHFESPTFTRPDRVGATFRDGAWNLPPIQPRLTAKVAWITGGGAISYAESTMGIVEQYRLGDIVGETTAGTNGNVNPFQVPGGFQVAFTGMRVRKRAGTPHHGVGIKPTVPVSRTLAGVTAGIDELLQRALAVVGQ